MSKKDKNNQNINSIPKYLLGNYFKKPIKWLAHLINDYGNSKHPFITTGTSYAYAIGDEKRRHPELTELQVRENIDLRIKQNRKKLGLPTENTPSLAAAGLALGSLYYPWLAIPDIIFDTAASIDEPSTSNNLHTIADFPETVAKFTPSKIDDYVAKGVLTLGNIDDAVSTSGRNMFSIFDKKTGKINNTIDKTSVRESTNIRYRKNGGQIRKMQTAAGGPLQLTPEELKYLEWNKMTPELKREYRTNRAKTHLLSGPNITNFWEAFQTYIGNRDPKNPRLQTGEAPNPGMRNPKLIIQGALKAKSIALRAAKISDKVFDRQYLRAISSGNSKRVLAVRDLHFRAKAPNTPVVDINGNPQLVYHKTPEEFTVFDNNRSIGKLNWFATPNAYGENGVFATGAGKNPHTMKLYVNMKNPHKPTIDEGIEPAYINEGEDGILGIVDRNMTNYFPSSNKAGKGFMMSGGVDNPFALKSTDALTYDNNGNIIPISLRDNFLINDIRFKQGGKMNIIEFLKKGSGIHIKEKNKGSFTRWCGGNVTEECIRRGKASSNPKIRKKATFADNARHFKHKDGGVLYIFLEGGKTPWWNKAINFVNNSGLGEAALNALSTYTLNKLIGASSDVAKALVDKDKASRILQANLAAELEARDIQLNNINPENPNAMSGDIVKNFIKNKLLSLKMALINLESNLEKAEIDWQTLQLKNLNTMNTLSGIGNVLMQGLGHVGLYIGNKLLTNVNNI